MHRPAVLILCGAALPALAQTAPLLPLAGLHDTYWPLQITQWIGPELPDATITLSVDDRGKQPVYEVVLTGRAGGKRTYYCNTPELLAEDKRKGYDAYLVAMQLDKPDSPGKGAQYLLRFNTEKGVPVVWQWVELTDVSDRGSGLLPLSAPFPLLLYREQGALAGEGTALKIGDVTSTADVWKEYAQLPYFVPYHGALVQGAHILSLASTQTAWTGTQPAALASGATWKLTNANGSTVTARVDVGKTTAVSFADERGDTATLDAQQSGMGWTVSRARLGPSGAKIEDTVSLVFTPPLAAGVESRFELIAGKKTKLGSGTVRTGADGLTESWTMHVPEAIKEKLATATTRLQP